MAGAQGHPYFELIASRASGAAFDWLSSHHSELSKDNFGLAYAGAGRRLGSAPVQLSSEEVERLSAARMVLPRGWPLSALARATLLIAICEQLDGDARLQLLSSVFKTGDNDERAALLRTLPLLPEPERFVDLGIEACRSHVQSVFEAIACENPYPARHFPDQNFNQLVLKSFFTGVAVKRIEGLADRRSAELVRMAQAYASERRAAGRSIPADLNLVTGTPTPPLGSPGAKP